MRPPARDFRLLCQQVQTMVRLSLDPLASTSNAIRLNVGSEHSTFFDYNIANLLVSSLFWWDKFDTVNSKPFIGKFCIELLRKFEVNSVF